MKPSYKELEQRIHELERASFEHSVIEEELRESEEKFKTIFENANDLIIYVDKKGTITDVNKKLEDLFGYKTEEVMGKHFADFKMLSPDDLDKSISLFGDVIDGKPIRIAEFKASHRNGNAVYIEGNARLIIKDGIIIGVLTIIRDITKRKLAETELKK